MFSDIGVECFIAPSLFSWPQSMWLWFPNQSGHCMGNDLHTERAFW